MTMDDDEARVGWRPTSDEPEVRFVQRGGWRGQWLEERMFPDDRLAIDPHEAWLWPILKALLLESDDRVFVDVGAHVGEWTVRVAAWLGNTVLAFEPNSASRSALHANIALNEVDHLVSVETHAVGADAGVERLMAPAVSSGSARIGAVAKHAGEFEEMVPTDRLDRLVPRPWWDKAVVKIDVEGFEAQVLAGATGLLLCGVPIVLEDHASLYGTPSAIPLLDESGYRSQLLTVHQHTDGREIRYWLARP